MQRKRHCIAGAVIKLCSDTFVRVCAMPIAGGQWQELLACRLIV
jgi:hypothetical protein